MRVGELSRRSGVSLPSIKYYLREGLLPPGERTGPNQADYGDDHIRRLRLVRALIDVGGLSVAATRAVLGAVDDPQVPLHHVLGTASFGIPAGASDDEGDDAEQRARRLLADLVARRGWAVDETNPAWGGAVGVLAAAERLEEGAFAAGLDAYAEAVEGLARHEVDSVLARGSSAESEGEGDEESDGDGEGRRRERIVEGVVVGTVLGDPLLAALRRLAQQDASTRRFHGEEPGAPDGPA